MTGVKTARVKAGYLRHAHIGLAVAFDFDGGTVAGQLRSVHYCQPITSAEPVVDITVSRGEDRSMYRLPADAKVEIASEVPA